MQKSFFYLLYKIIASAFLIVVLSSSVGLAQPVKRHVLSLYNPKTNPDPYFSLMHQNAEVVLNHLGLIVEHQSALDDFPDDVAMQKYLGVVTWFRDRQVFDDTKIDTYCDWLSRQIDAGRKVVILEEFGFRKKNTSPLSPSCTKMFTKLGGELTPNVADNTYFFEIKKMDADMLEHERKLLFTEPLLYNQIKATDKNAKVYLTIKRTDMTDADADLVFTTRQGGYAHTSYVLYEVLDLKKKQWRLNPFRFFSEAFGLKGVPVPDTTTLNGNRIFYSHIDGDGIFNVSDIDRKSYSGEIIHENILKKYAPLPITVSLITGYFDLPEFSGARARELYGNMFKLKNVEVASHGYAHPTNWQKQTLALRIPGYTFSPETEIKTSTELVRKLMVDLGLKKTVNLFQWTGNCLVSASDMLIAYKNNFLNINGGDTRFDDEFDSVSFVAPLGIVRSGLVQIYASNSNENTYTNMWQGPYYGYRDVITTFARTESPRRLKPVNIYYHFYSGETQASLTVLKKAYDWALKEDILPITTSGYTQLVGEFFKMKIIKMPNSFWVESGDFLKTVRIDGETRRVDLNKSRGVLGFSHHQGSLYIALDKGHEHEIFLTSARPQSPFIASANVDIDAFKTQDLGIYLTFAATISPKIKLGGLSPLTKYHVTSQKNDFLLASDTNGELTVSLEGLENTTAISLSVVPSGN